MKSFQTITLSSVCALLGAFFVVAPAHAYTGSYGILPAPAQGPDSVTVINVDVDTETFNPQAIYVGGSYVEWITIETDPAMVSNILVKEYPPLEGDTFDIIVPQPLQNALVQATVYVWAPDGESLTIEHDHQGEPIVYETATKVLPEQTDGNGNVLWVFTVSSFSSFTLIDSTGAQNTSIPLDMTNMITLLVIALGSVVAPLGLRKN